MGIRTNPGLIRRVLLKLSNHGLVVSLIHFGGHFDGSSVLNWKNGAKGKGVLLTGDMI
jgi:hypothetical protein